MKQWTLILGLSFILLNAESQNVFPSYNDNASWSVLRCDMPPNPCVTKFYTYTYDTTFCGHTYSLVDSLEFNSRGYFRSDSIRTYFRKSNNCSDKEYLIYDYSVSVGDTIWAASNILLSAQDTAQFLVDSVEFVNYGGVIRKRIKLLYHPCSSTGPFDRPIYWIQGIGSDIHPFYSFYCLCDGCEVSFTTLCYDSLSVELYKNSYFNTCDTTINVGIEDLSDNSQISIFPNPTTENFTISLSNTQIANGIIYSPSGQLIRQFNIQNKIELNVKNLHPGIYLIYLTTDKGALQRRFVIAK